MGTRIPVTTKDDGLREWDITLPDGTYYVRDDEGDWSLYKLTGPCLTTDWAEVATGMAIEDFLQAHNLELVDDDA